MSYARALQNSAHQSDSIRNITLKGTKSQMEASLRSIQSDQFILDMQDLDVVRKSDTNYTIKAKDAAMAKAFHDHILKTYDGDLVIVSEVIKKQPMIKISGAKIEINQDEDTEELKSSIQDQIFFQNSWLPHNSDLQVIEVYTISNPRMAYTNIIITTSLECHDALLKRGHIKLGFGNCRLSEHIDLIQCQTCNRYGHFRHTCNFPANCKRCGQAHDKSFCTATNAQPHCHNCSLENENGANYNTRHHTNDNRCPTRINRINALKAQALKN